MHTSSDTVMTGNFMDGHPVDVRPSTPPGRRAGTATAPAAPGCRPLVAMVGPLLADGCLLVLAPPAGVGRQLTAGLVAGDSAASLVTGSVALAAWGVAGWLTLCVVLTAAARLPGVSGSAARAVADRVTPDVIRRLAGGGAAASLALAPALLPAAAHAGTTPAATCRAVTSTALPSVDRPLPACSPAPGPAHVRAAPDRSRGAAPASPGRVAPMPTSAAVRGAHVVVRGDSLWSVARAELTHKGDSPPAALVAARWPAWWAANRAEVGSDPSLLRVGEVLLPPPAAPVRGD